LNGNGSITENVDVAAARRSRCLASADGERAHKRAERAAAATTTVVTTAFRWWLLKFRSWWESEREAVPTELLFLQKCRRAQQSKAWKLKWSLQKTPLLLFFQAKFKFTKKCILIKKKIAWICNLIYETH